MKNRILLTLALSLIGTVAAQAADFSDAFSRYKHALSATAGFADGGFSLGADYEYSAYSQFGTGGFARFYSKDDKKSSAPGIFAFGGFIRAHFPKKAWDFYISPGFAIMIIDSQNKDETAFGPSLNLGLLYKIHEYFSIGVENTKMHGWIADDYKGAVVDDLMFKMRFEF